MTREAETLRPLSVLSDRSLGAGRRLGIGIAVAVAYVLAARLGFRFAFVAEQVTTVWAPTGIGLAALVLWGPALAPAIWIGAFAANAGSSAPLWTAAAVATGNTLEAIAGAWMLTRVVGFDPKLRRLRDVVAIILAGAALSTLVSATVGV
jgi:integral membrane sensor domain MASE1